MSYKFRNLVLLLTFALIAAPTQISSQVFTYKGTPVSSEEFTRQFLKNHNDEEKITAAAINEYLDMYINYKLKVQDAIDAGLDTNADYKQELKMYRDQLARNYLYDREVTDELIKEAYARRKEEINCSHILILLPPNPTPSDTLKAYLKIKAMYDSVVGGKASFEQMARHSDDQSNAGNGGNLGYFTAFQLVYPFENAAYNTAIGGTSKVFRTQFGYHFIKVLGRRPYRGDIRLRHLSLRTGIQNAGDDEAKRLRIQTIYNDIISGKTTFPAAVREFSQDFQSRNNGGELDLMSSTHFVGDPDKTKLLDVGFGLSKPGDVSVPFKTLDGWHIVQLEEIKPLPSFDQLKLGLKNQVQEDMRSLKSRDALIEKVKKEDNYVYYPSSMALLANSLDTNFVKGKFDEKDLPEFAKADVQASNPKKGAPLKNPFSGDAIPVPLRQQTLFMLGDEQHTVLEFARYLGRAIHPVNTDKTSALNDYYSDWLNNMVVDYRDRHLTEKSEEFRNIYQEYKEGILLFNRMQQEVWDKSNNDSAGLEKFYASISDSFKWQDRFDMVVFYCEDQKTMKMVSKLMKSNKISNDSISKKMSAIKAQSAIYTQGKFELSDTASFTNPTVLKVLFNNPKGTYKMKNNKIYNLNEINRQWIVVKVNKFIKSEPKKIDETRGPVVSKYQDYLQDQWIKKLREKYSVSTNRAEVDKIISKLSSK